MNEAETRAELIDPLLVAAGWGVVEGSRIRREFPIAPGRIEGGGRRGKALSADYVLSYRNTALAVVEAKADTLPLTEGVGSSAAAAAAAVAPGPSGPSRPPRGRVRAAAASPRPAAPSSERGCVRNGFQ